MRGRPAAVRRICLATDVQGYTGRDYGQKLEVQTRLLRITEWALDQAGLRVRDVLLQPQGDGHVAVLPPGIDEFRAVPGLVLGFRDAIAAANTQLAASMRMRLSMTQGVVQRGPTGFVSRAVENAAAVVNSDVMRDWLNRSPDSDLAVALSEDLFTDLVERRSEPLDAGAFQAVTIPVKGGSLATRLWAARDPDPGRFVESGGFIRAGATLGACAVSGVALGWEFGHHGAADDVPSLPEDPYRTEHADTQLDDHVHLRHDDPEQHHGPEGEDHHLGLGH